MTVEAFLAWAEAAPRGRHELVEGRVVAMAPERARHVAAKQAAWLALRDALRAAGAPCRAYVEGLGVRVGPGTCYGPDVLVTCGAPPAPDALLAPDPVLVVEIASPSSGRTDAIRKFRDYFLVPSIRHYLLVDPEARVVLHHHRQPDGAITSTILGDGLLDLDPPGIAVAVGALFEEL